MDDGMTAQEEWESELEDEDEEIERAVNAAIGMSLVSPVKITAVPVVESLGDWEVRVTAVRIGDSHTIRCADADSAVQLAQDINAQITEVLNDLPPWSGRQPITLNV